MRLLGDQRGEPLIAIQIPLSAPAELLGLWRRVLADALIFTFGRR